MFPYIGKYKAFTDLIDHSEPVARAQIRGTGNYRPIHGVLRLYDAPGGTVVTAEVFRLPAEKKPCAANIFALHIHSGSSCTGTEKDPLKNTEGHFNPEDCPHPAHAGDLPPLFASRDGYACMAVFTDRFKPKDVIRRTVVIHKNPDDFTTQPAGNAGEKIACGEIYLAKRT